MAKRILIVDDDQYIRELYAEVLSAEKYTVETSSDGEDGLRKLQQGGYDAVLLDMMMPKLDGLGILDSLEKNVPIKKNGPIILLSNVGHNPVIDNAKKKGASAFFIKADVTPNQIVAIIKDLLEK
jgi:CheY-like chemotaxis protein